MAQIIEVRDPADYEKTLAEVSKDQQYVIVIVTGGIDPNSGKNWCGDCERAKPNIQEYVLNKAEGKVLMCIVEKRESWSGRSDHPYKQHHVLKVKGVPTICLMREGEVMARAENDEDFDNIELLTMIAKPE